MSKKYLGILGILVILLVSILIIEKHISLYPTPTKTAPTNKRAPLPKEVTITLTKNGFTPSQVTINIGSAVRWKNKSGAQETVNSDNYPTNQLHKELNFGVFSNNSSVVYTFTKPGTYGYHNQLHPSQHGKIIVVQ